MQSDLLPRVREDIDNARENGWDFFGPLGVGMGSKWDDAAIAADLRESTNGYDGVSDNDLISAVSTVRKECNA